jgi:hypothetical protein
MFILLSIPQELINILACYLEYNESIILIESIAIKVQFEYLLLEKYPAFYHILTLCKTHDRYYRNNYTYEQGYIFMEGFNKYITHKINNYEIEFKNINEHIFRYSEDSPEFYNEMNLDIERIKDAINYKSVDKFFDIFCLKILGDEFIDTHNKYTELADIYSLYLIIKNYLNNELYIYKRELPQIPYINKYFYEAINNYSNNLDSIIQQHSVRHIKNSRCMGNLCKILLYIIKNKDFTSETRNRIQNLENMGCFMEYMSWKIMHQHILDYIDFNKEN